MKVVVLLSTIALVAAYTHLDDTVDFRAMVDNPSELLKFTHCILDKRDCDERSIGYRQVVAEAVEGECGSCTDYQKFTLYTFLTGMQTNLPEEYEHFKQMYDPEDVHIRKTLPVVSKYKDYA